MPNFVGLYRHSHLGKIIHRLKFPKFWVGALLAFFEQFLKKVSPSRLTRCNLEMISFNLVPRNLILIKVTRT